MTAVDAWLPHHSIRCIISTRQEDGSCNACQRRDEDAVILTNMRTISFRVCNSCAKDLSEKLAAVLAGEKRERKERSDE